MLILTTSFQGFFAFLRIFIIKSSVFIKKSSFFAVFLSFLTRGQLFFTEKHYKKIIHYIKETPECMQGRTSVFARFCLKRVSTLSSSLRDAASPNRGGFLT